MDEGADACRRGGECGSDAVQRSGPRDGRAPMLSDSRTADRGAREAGRCAGTLHPDVTEADDSASAALPSPQTLAVLGVGSWTLVASGIAINALLRGKDYPKYWL